MKYILRDITLLRSSGVELVVTGWGDTGSWVDVSGGTELPLCVMSDESVCRVLAPVVGTVWWSVSARYNGGADGLVSAAWLGEGYDNAESYDGTCMASGIGCDRIFG